MLFRSMNTFLYKDVFILISLIYSFALLSASLEFTTNTTIGPAAQLLILLLDVYLIAMSVSAFSKATGHTTGYIFLGHLWPMGIFVIIGIIAYFQL